MKGREIKSQIFCAKKYSKSSHQIFWFFKRSWLEEKNSYSGKCRKETLKQTITIVEKTIPYHLHQVKTKKKVKESEIIHRYKIR